MNDNSPNHSSDIKVNFRTNNNEEHILNTLIHFQNNTQQMHKKDTTTVEHDLIIENTTVSSKLNGLATETWKPQCI